MPCRAAGADRPVASLDSLYTAGCMVEMTIIYDNSLESPDVRVDDDYTDECTKLTVHAVNYIMHVFLAVIFSAYIIR